MSSRESAAPLPLELQPSRRRAHWRLLTHLAVLAGLPLLQSFWLAAAAFAVVSFSWYRSRREPAIGLRLRSDGGWSLFEDGVAVDAELAETPFVQTWLVILPLRVDGQRRIRRIAIFPDHLPEQDFRRLRVRLRSTKTPSDECRRCGP